MKSQEPADLLGDDGDTSVPASTSSNVFRRFDAQREQRAPQPPHDFQNRRYFNAISCLYCGGPHSEDACPNRQEHLCYYCGVAGHESSACPLNTCAFCGEEHRSCRRHGEMARLYVKQCFRCGGSHLSVMCCTEHKFGGRPRPFCVYCGHSHAVLDCQERIAPWTPYMSRRDRRRAMAFGQSQEQRFR